MSRVTLILTNRETRERACAWIMKAPVNTRVELKESKRSVPQNDLMHAALTDIARQLPWSGVKLGKDDWKLVLLDYFWRLRGESLRLVPNIGGTGFVPLSGRSSSDLAKEEMAEFIDLIHAFGAEHGVQFSDSDQGGAGANNPRAEVA
jgi:hypothetical protein